ncbi:MAG: (deoxy)nucleoside triphosphate pyrophosphohydrolase [Bacteroidota bacterium]|uniref:(deoxy)nucleoside triphosphate pyrophosphohydrolase n=1 Tax=Parabacteroides sp. FAFU027 TaxID=2922715 RepID=UPI001FAEFDA3|nr:(deoxy)nucleoside triphosphate pyrophosphohydrolase [Parabacteroides sp. FAFU027]MDP4270292.1 (deoxy)nucleoside triphosphate pyrophosphohydrolase [Bacteroidota bacterium]
MIDVTCAIIIRDGLILAVQRSERMKHPLKWEFPGGKVESGESAETCIMRELKEELHIEVEILRVLSPVEFHYSEKSIRLIPFEVTLLSNEIILKEHSRLKWLNVTGLSDLDWLPADVLVIEQYLKLKK